MNGLKVRIKDVPFLSALYIKFFLSIIIDLMNYSLALTIYIDFYYVL